MNDEIWKLVENYEGRYEISNQGRVRSLTCKACILKAAFGTKGYLQVCLTLNGNKKTHKIHRLVCDAFIRKLEAGESVNHKNNIKTDNAIENLEILSISENCKKAWRDGLMAPTLAHNAANPIPKKLTWDQVDDIRGRRYYNGLNRDLGIEFNVHRMTIGEIRRGEIWKTRPQCQR